MYLYEPADDKTYNKTCATSEDSDQPIQTDQSLCWSHVPSTASGLSKQRQKRILAILRSCIGWSESFLVTQPLLQVTSCVAHMSSELSSSLPQNNRKCIIWAMLCTTYEVQRAMFLCVCVFFVVFFSDFLYKKNASTSRCNSKRYL